MLMVAEAVGRVMVAPMMPVGVRMVVAMIMPVMVMMLMAVVVFVSVMVVFVAVSFLADQGNGHGVGGLITSTGTAHDKLVFRPGRFLL